MFSHNYMKILQYKPPAEAGVAVTQEDGISTSSPDRVQSGESFGEFNLTFFFIVMSTL